MKEALCTEDLEGGGSSSSPGNPAVSQRAWIALVCLVVLASVISYADRTNIGIAIIPMSRQYGWGGSQQGLVLGAFMLGYLTTQILGGLISDDLQRCGPNGAFLTLATGSALWSLFTVLTPLAARMGLPYLVVCRVLLGVGEGVGFPAIHSMLSRYVPNQWKNVAVASTNAGCYIGGLVALLASAPIAADAALGWPCIFYIFGSLGALWLLPWLLLWAFSFFQRQPVDLADPLTKSIADKTSVPTTHTLNRRWWRRLLTHRAVWVLLVVNAGLGWGFWTFMSWMPTYFSERYGVNIKDLGWASVLPCIVQSAVSFFAGLLGDYLTMERTSSEGKRVDPFMSMRTLRIGSQTVSLWMASLFMLLSAYAAPSVALGVVFFTLTLGFHALSTLGANSGHLDVCPEHAGLLFGIINTFGVGAGLLGTTLTGFLLQRTKHNWTVVFVPTAVVSIICSVVWMVWGQANAIDLVSDEPHELHVNVRKREDRLYRARKLARVSSTALMDPTLGADNDSIDADSCDEHGSTEILVEAGSQ